MPKSLCLSCENGMIYGDGAPYRCDVCNGSGEVTEADSEPLTLPDLKVNPDPESALDHCDFCDKRLAGDTPWTWLQTPAAPGDEKGERFRQCYPCAVRAWQDDPYARAWTSMPNVDDFDEHIERCCIEHCDGYSGAAMNECRKCINEGPPCANKSRGFITDDGKCICAPCMGDAVDYAMHIMEGREDA